MAITTVLPKSTTHNDHQLRIRMAAQGHGIPWYLCGRSASHLALVVSLRLALFLKRRLKDETVIDLKLVHPKPPQQCRLLLHRCASRSNSSTIHWELGFLVWFCRLCMSQESDGLSIDLTTLSGFMESLVFKRLSFKPLQPNLLLTLTFRFNYYSSYPKDHVYLKTMVSIVWRNCEVLVNYWNSIHGQVMALWWLDLQFTNLFFADRDLLPVFSTLYIWPL